MERPGSCSSPGRFQAKNVILAVLLAAALPVVRGVPMYPSCKFFFGNFKETTYSNFNPENVIVKDRKLVSDLEKEN